jgi:cytochrome c-type biogenesis protein CcmF
VATTRDLLAAWIASTAVPNLASRIASHPATGWARRFSSQPGSYYGMLLAHLGVSVFILGVTVVSGFQSESATSRAARIPAETAFA